MLYWKVISVVPVYALLFSGLNAVIFGAVES
jgi:hypothetical protein